MTYKIYHKAAVLRLEDQAIIPFDPANTDYQAYLAWLEKGNAPEPLDVPVPVVPQSVTPLQARKALYQAGMLEQVQTAINAADAMTKMTWEFASSIERHSPTVDALAQALKLTDKQLDDLFTLAASFTVS